MILLPARSSYLLVERLSLQSSVATRVTGEQAVIEDAPSPLSSALGGRRRPEEKLRRPPGAPLEEYVHMNVQVLRVGPLDDESYFVLRDLQMTSKSDKIH